MSTARKPQAVPAPKLTAAQIAHALHAAAREDFPTFVEVCYRSMFVEPFDVQPWHAQLFELLADIYAGRAPRTIISICPRAGKTLLLLMFVAWTWGRHPKSNYILSSYAEPLAVLNAGLLQRILQDEAYRKIFPAMEISRESSAKDSFSIVNGGACRAVGTGGSIQGYGAGGMTTDPLEWRGCVVSDDQLKVSESRSETVRTQTFDYFSGTLYTRRNSPHTPVIVTAQRCHESDVSGQLLAGKLGGAPWRELKIPALREDGSSFWERRFPAEELRAMRDSRPWIFWSQYQGEPKNLAGNMFKVGAIPILDTLPNLSGAQLVRSWDLAGTTETEAAQRTGDADYTVGILYAWKDGRGYILDIIRVRQSAAEVRELIQRTAVRDGKKCQVLLPQDGGQAGKAQAQSFVQMLPGYSVKIERPTGSKITRAEPCASACNVGLVSVVAGPNVDALMQEMISFPAGRHDDTIDALSSAHACVAVLDDAALSAARVKAEYEAIANSEPVHSGPNGQPANALEAAGLRRVPKVDRSVYSFDPANLDSVPRVGDRALPGKAPPGLTVADSPMGKIYVGDTRPGETYQQHDARVCAEWSAEFNIGPPADYLMIPPKETRP